MYACAFRNERVLVVNDTQEILDLFRDILAEEGFDAVLASYAPKELDAVIERYYSGQERVVVLEIETEGLMSRVLNEPSTNSEIYPHVYGPINRKAIIRAFERVPSGK